MLIWIVNPFDPLPGDPEQEGRYATLARVLLQRGHAVRWWTSSFSHRFKKPVRQDEIRDACAALGIDVDFLDAPPYHRNVSFQRMRSHAALARDYATRAAQVDTPPDVVVVSSPPPILARRAVELAHQHHARSIIDVQDLWPDLFATVAPRPLRPLLKPLISIMRRDVRRAAVGCDAIVGVADAYAQDSFKECTAPKPVATIPLGVDLADVDAAAAAGVCEQFTKPAGACWLAYTGSLNRNYDFMTILRAAVLLRDRLTSDVRFFLTGRGEYAEHVEQFVRTNDLRSVTLTGFLPFDQWAYLLSQCDVGFNASFPESLIFLPNKIFYYLAGGAAVLNTIPGQCSRTVLDNRCGLDYRAGDPQSCAAAIERLVRRPDERAAMQQAARRLAETTYDRKVLYPKYAELIEEVGAGRSAG
jgi:glycosyltransferase involved in cell wall biosynthesis